MSKSAIISNYDYNLELRTTSHHYFRLVLQKERVNHFQYTSLECYKDHCNPWRVSTYAYLMKDGTVQQPFNEDYFRQGYSINTLNWIKCPYKRVHLKQIHGMIKFCDIMLKAPTDQRAYVSDILKISYDQLVTNFDIANNRHIAMLKHDTLRNLAIIFYDEGNLETANYFCERILVMDRYDQVC